MATLTTKLTLSSNSSATDRLNVTSVDTLVITNPSVNIARQSIATDSAFNVLTAADNTSITYVYLKNLDKTNIITVKDDAGNNFLDLSPREFVFLPVKGAVGLEVQANTAACVLEYGYWTKA
jgi:myo-inositol-hexaphosphate 3-phosphohydrolase